MIAQICVIHSANKDNSVELKAIKNAQWIVESEFQVNNSRALLLDLNKVSTSKSKEKAFYYESSSRKHDKNMGDRHIKPFNGCSIRECVFSHRAASKILDR